MCNFKQTLELSHHDIVSKDLRAFWVELDREFKSRFEQFDRRFEEAHHKFKNLSKAVLSRNTHETGISELTQRLIEERVECHLGDEAKHRNSTVLEEQTDSADDSAVDVPPMTKESVRRRVARWEVRGTHDHDAIIEHTESVFKKEISCSWDLFKALEYDVTTDQTDCVLEEDMPYFVGSTISTWSYRTGGHCWWGWHEIYQYLRRRQNPRMTRLDCRVAYCLFKTKGLLAIRFALHFSEKCSGLWCNYRTCRLSFVRCAQNTRSQCNSRTDRRSFGTVDVSFVGSAVKTRS